MHSLSNGIATSLQSGSTTRKIRNPLPNVVIHPPQPINEGQMDNALSSLLRMMRLPEVLATDTETAARMMGGEHEQDGRTDEDIIHEMRAIKEEHDYRVERATMAVRMLRDKYNWKRRIGDGTVDEEDSARPITTDQVQVQQDGGESESESGEEDEEDDDDMEMVTGAAVRVNAVVNGQQPPALNGDGGGSDSDGDFEMVDGTSVIAP